MLKHSKLFAGLSLFLVGLLSGSFMTVSAASDPEIRLTAGGLNDGKATVTLSLENMPSGKNVEYAQIELACKTEDFDIVSESFAMAAKPSKIKTTVKQDAGKGSILLLIEPEENTFAGLTDGNVCSFTVQNKTGGQIDPEFLLSAVLILKDGTEYEWNTNLSADITGSSQSTGENSTKPTSPETGDNSHIPFWSVLLLAGICGLAGVTVYSRRSVLK